MFSFFCVIIIPPRLSTRSPAASLNGRAGVTLLTLLPGAFLASYRSRDSITYFLLASQNHTIVPVDLLDSLINLHNANIKNTY